MGKNTRIRAVKQSTLSVSGRASRWVAAVPGTDWTGTATKKRGCVPPREAASDNIHRTAWLLLPTRRMNGEYHNGSCAPLT